jgi:hypothetical protein
MMKKMSAALALLMLLSFSGVGAEEITVKVSGDRNAVVQFTGTESADPDASGSIKASADFKAGKSAIDGEITVKNSPETQDANVSFYTSASGTSLEAIGYLDAKVPPSPDAPKKFTVNVESVTEGDQSAADFKFDMLMPTGGEQIPEGSGDMKFDGDFKAMTSSGKFSFSGADINADEVPFDSLTLEITEVENKTTITFEVRMPKSDPSAAQLDQLPQMAGMLEGQLKQANIQYEDLEFPAPKEEGEQKVGTGKVTLIDLRGTIKPFLGMASGQLQGEMGPDVDVKGAFEKMLDIKFDKFAFSFKVEANKMDGTFEVNVSNMNSFLEGYMVILPAVQAQQNRELSNEIAREMGPAGMGFQPFIETLLNANANQGVSALKAALASSLTLSGNAEFKMGVTGDEQAKDMTLTASGNLLSKNYKDYVTKAKEQGVPVAEKAVGKIDLDMTDGTQLSGNLYLYTDGDLFHFYKGMMADAAKSANAPPDVIKELEAFDMKGLTFKADMAGNKITLKGNSETTDLTGITKLALSKAQVDATLTGFGMDMQMPEGQDTAIAASVYFSEFLPGKSDAQIKEMMGLPASAVVTMDAPADDVKLVAVEAPEIKVDGKLAEVQTEGQKLLAAGPESAAGGSGGGGGNKWGLIALGALLLVGVGGFLMFGKK